MQKKNKKSQMKEIFISRVLVMIIAV